MPVSFPPSAFWDFSLRLYARPGVADACLRLQARHGIDVNMLLCCLWRGAEGERLTRRRIRAMITRVRTLHEQVVKPLRTARITLKSMLDGDPALGAAIAAVRAAVKASELDAEHVEQLILAGMFSEPRATGAREPHTLARANAESYCAVLGLRLSAADRADLDFVAGSLDGWKTQQSHVVGPIIRRAGKRGHNRPLASGRRGA